VHAQLHIFPKHYRNALTVIESGFLGLKFSLKYAPAALLDNIVWLPSGSKIARKMRFKWTSCGTLCQPPGWLGLTLMNCTSHHHRFIVDLLPEKTCILRKRSSVTLPLWGNFHDWKLITILSTNIPVLKCLKRHQMYSNYYTFRDWSILSLSWHRYTHFDHTSLATRFLVFMSSIEVFWGYCAYFCVFFMIWVSIPVIQYYQVH